MAKSSVHEKATLLGDAVFGANDGIITTFAIIAGSAGASLSSRVVLILGFANLFADGLSMASGNYLGVKSEIDYEKANKSGRTVSHSPLNHGIITFFSFIVAGLLPLLPYVFGFTNKFELSALFVAMSLFVVGGLRNVITKKSFARGGFEMLLIGGFAALVAYVIGFELDKYVI